MIDLSIAVEMTDGRSNTYPVTPRVQVEFERHFKKSILSALNEPSLEYIYWLGWASMKKAGDVVKLFDEWLDMVCHAEVVVEDGSLPLE